MTTFVLLRIEDDSEAGTLVRDMSEYPGSPLLTPVQENEIHATIEAADVTGWDDLDPRDD